MAGGYYAALSGMRARTDALDRIASDIANANTVGYKTERNGTREAPRPSFGDTLQSAVDVTNGHAKIDFRPGAVTTTGRSLDVAIEGRGFFVAETAQGPRYTRNGRLQRSAGGTLANDEGDPILGTTGPIKIGHDEIAIDPDGTVREAGKIVGTLKIVEFPEGTNFSRGGGTRFIADRPPTVIERPSILPGNLEQSNSSLVERVAELSEVSRNYQTLLKGVQVLLNDIDKGAISELGRR
jgi:flagellar basal-body rod protein FlgF